MQKGIDGQVFVTTDWSNLNSELWYVVTAGVYSSKSDAKAALSGIQTLYPSAYVKYSGDYQGDSLGSCDLSEDDGSYPAFYGIWCGASKTESGAQKLAASMNENGLEAQIFITTDWSNLNSVKWYVITAGVYSSKEEAAGALTAVQKIYPDAYIKYSGYWQGTD